MHCSPTHRQPPNIDCNQGSYKKMNVKFKNIQEHFWGEKKIFQEHFRRVIRTFYLQYYQQSHFGLWNMFTMLILEGQI